MKNRLSFLAGIAAGAAITLMVLAVLLPVFAEAHAKAREAHCPSNITQLSLDFMMEIQGAALCRAAA